jgi:hypothetical protein
MALGVFCRIRSIPRRVGPRALATASGCG